MEIDSQVCGFLDPKLTMIFIVMEDVVVLRKVGMIISPLLHALMLLLGMLDS